VCLLEWSYYRRLDSENAAYKQQREQAQAKMDELISLAQHTSVSWGLLCLLLLILLLNINYWKRLMDSDFKAAELEGRGVSDP